MKEPHQIGTKRNESTYCPPRCTVNCIWAHEGVWTLGKNGARDNFPKCRGIPTLLRTIAEEINKFIGKQRYKLARKFHALQPCWARHTKFAALDGADFFAMVKPDSAARLTMAASIRFFSSNG